MAAKDRKKRRRRPERARTSLARSVDEGPLVVAESRLPRWLKPLLLGASAIYLVGLFFDGVQPKTSRALLPAPVLYFVQATCLFPHAARAAIDYRLEGWDCDAQRFRELEPAPYFPIRANDKESRFYRTAHFHRQNRPVMEALERYVLDQERARSSTRWGGIRLSSIRTPLPEPGQPVSRWERVPLTDTPPKRIKRWFYTPVSRRELYCDRPARPLLQSASPEGKP